MVGNYIYTRHDREIHIGKGMKPFFYRAVATYAQLALGNVSVAEKCGAMGGMNILRHEAKSHMFPCAGLVLVCVVIKPICRTFKRAVRGLFAR